MPGSESLVIDFTVLSDGAVHNRFGEPRDPPPPPTQGKLTHRRGAEPLADPNSCNDPDAKRELAKRVEREFDRYKTDAALLAAGTVRVCEGMSWRGEVQRLRAEVPGHFFAPVFAPP